MGENEQGGMLRTVVVLGLIALIAAVVIGGVVSADKHMRQNLNDTSVLIKKAIDDNSHGDIKSDFVAEEDVPSDAWQKEWLGDDLTFRDTHFGLLFGPVKDGDHVAMINQMSNIDYRDDARTYTAISYVNSASNPLTTERDVYNKYPEGSVLVTNETDDVVGINTETGADYLNLSEDFTSFVNLDTNEAINVGDHLDKNLNGFHEYRMFIFHTSDIDQSMTNDENAAGHPTTHVDTSKPMFLWIPRSEVIGFNDNGVNQGSLASWGPKYQVAIW